MQGEKFADFRLLKLKGQDMEDWIIGGFTIIGVVIGGLITWFNTRLQLRQQEAQQRKQLILSRLEELHSLLTEFSMVCFNLIQAAASNIGLKVVEEEFSTTLKTSKKMVSVNENFSLERIYMLIGFYAPELKEYEKKLSEANELYSEMLLKRTLATLKQSKEQIDNLGELSSHYVKVDRVCSEIKAEVIALSKKYL